MLGVIHLHSLLRNVTSFVVSDVIFDVIFHCKMHFFLFEAFKWSVLCGFGLSRSGSSSGPPTMGKGLHQTNDFQVCFLHGSTVERRTVWWSPMI